MLGLLLLLHAAAALAAPALLRRWGPRACHTLAIVPAAAFGWLLAQAPAMRRGQTIVEIYPWAPRIGVAVALRLDTLSWVLALLITGIGALALSYSASYFAAGESGVRRFGGCFLGFAGAMLGIVVSDSLILLYVFWELTTVFSYLLIGHIPERRAARAAARQALLVTSFGGLAMLPGLLMLGHRAGSYRLTEILAHPPPDSGFLTVALVLILVGALSKSAQLPFSFWLPSAMAAPTPVSAYLHAAAMVKAGVYLIAVLAPVFAPVGPWRPIVLGVGIATMLVGGWAALRQTDLKLLLAHGTVSQLGLLVAVLGTGTRDTALAGLAMLVAHALFKAALFLVVGIIDRQAGHRDLRHLFGLWRRMPLLFAVAGLACASMAGLPPLLGFVTKDAVFAAFHSPVVLAGLVAGSALTVAYSARFLWGAFAAKGGSMAARAGVPASGPRTPTEAPAPALAFLAAPAILGALGVALAPFARTIESYLGPYAGQVLSRAMDGLALDHGLHLVVWPGLTAELGWSALALAAGLAVFAWRRAAGAVEAALRLPRDGVWLFQKITYGVERAAIEVTGATQRGSLPFYVGSVLALLAAALGGAALPARTWPVQVIPWASPVELAVGGWLIGAAVFAVKARRRMTAMLFVGLTGYGTALIYVLRGAPDLALTQLLVETVSILFFVLVFRRLPTHFSERVRYLGHYLRRMLAVGAGVVVGLLSVVAVGGRRAVSISEQFPAAAEQGGGRNVVNLTLVDIRAWDTMGEISVLVAMATGVASLIFIRPRVRRVPRRGQARRVATAAAPAGPAPGGAPPPGRRSWLVGARAMMPQHRSIFFEVVTRLIFHTIVLYSVFLLFSGHNAPGGGFAGGLVVGMAIAVRYLAGGAHEIDEAAPVDAGIVVGTGLLLALGIGATGLVLGAAFLDSTIFNLQLPLVGEVHIVTSLFFDIGVYLVVLGLSLDILRSLGAEVDRQLGGVRILPRRAGRAHER